ncbi:MAG: histidine kinase [Chloroflexota bacterium]
MMIIDFFYGLAFGGLGLAAYLQYRQAGELPLKKQLPWLAAFGFAYGTTGWIEMFLVSDVSTELSEALMVLRIILQPLSGLLLLIFGWGTLTQMPLPSWAIFIPGILIVPIAFVITYALTTFITPSPIGIPVDIWSRYLMYLPGSILAGIGFLRQWHAQREHGYRDVGNLMLGAGIAFLFEAFVVGLVVPAAPYGPASYYNYDRSIYNAFLGEQSGVFKPYGLTSWLDYARVLETTGVPIQFWRMLSAISVTFFVVRALGVFDRIKKRQVQALQEERDRAQKMAFEAEIAARQTAENWTEVLVNVSQRITEFANVDSILLYIVENARKLLQSDFIAIALINDDYACLELKCFSKDGMTEMVDNSMIVENPLILNVLLTSRPYRSQENESPESLENVCFCNGQSANAVAVVPLCLENNPIGALWIAREEKELYSETDLIWLACLADQVVIAIQHGLMASRLQSLSVIEERARIAREMHDGLAQVLGYLNLQVQTLTALLEQNKLKALQSELRQMREAIQVAHADVRENILSLRTTLANEKGLASSIKEYLEEFGIQTGVETQFVNGLEEELNLSSLAEVQLVCILQEALTNVRKHANAKKVEILLTKEKENEGDYIRFKVWDDGIGFASCDSKRSFGLQTMRERAHSVGGKLIVQSTPGKGTRVECRLPCLQQENIRKQTIVYP